MSFQNCGQTGLINSEEFASESNSGSFASPTAAPFQCNTTSSPVSVAARRLTKTEYANTVRRLLNKQTANDLTAIMNELNPLIATIPDDVDTKFSRLDSKVAQAHLNGYLFVAKKLGSLIAASDTRSKNFFGSCATLSDLSVSCQDQFFAGMGKKIFRRPLASQEITGLKADYAAFVSDKNAFLVARMLMSSHFLMKVEIGGTEISSSLLEISSYELANRLSYHFLQSMPDDELFAAADDGSLKTDQGLTNQINRLMGASLASQTKSTIAEFYSQWLGLYQLPNPETATGPGYVAFANNDSLTKASMIQEIQDMTSYYTFVTDGKFNDLLNSNVSFAKNEDLAKIYGVSKWSGDNNALVRFPAGERSGLLTRAALLANSTTSTNPIGRGVKVRREFLCDTLAPPPPSISNMLRIPEPDPNFSTRQRFEHKTADAFCMGCHSQINPIGFAFENFDSLGRYRTIEKIFDENGNFLNQKGIDPVVAPAIIAGDRRQTASPVEFNRMLADSGKAQNCFVRQYFHFTYRQKPDLQQDGCALEDMRQNLTAADGSLKKMFMNVAKSRAFKLKNLASP